MTLKAVQAALATPYPNMHPEDALVAAAKAFADGTRLAASIMDPITAMAAMEECGAYFEDTLTNAMNGALDHAENVYNAANWTTPKHPDAP